MRWIDGPPGDAIGEVRTLSAAGDVGAGLRWRMEGQNQVDHRVYLWSEAAGIQVLPLPRDGLRPVTSMRLTADAAMLGVLFSTPSPAGTTYESWLYSTATQNWSRLEDHFTRAGISTAGWEGFRLGGISDDGLTFTGVAFLQGQYQHFYARVPAPAALCLPALAGMLFVRRRVRPIAGA